MTAVITLPHELVVATRQSVRFDVREALAAGARAIVLDASQTAYIDSSGIGMLLGVTAEVRAVGGRLLVAGISDDAVRDVLRLTSADTRLHLAPSVAEALEEFGAPAPAAT